MVLGLVAKAFGFFEKVALAYTAGASGAMDAYVTAAGVAFYLFVLIDDILAPVFLSIYVQTRKKFGQPTANKFFMQVLGATAVILLVLVVTLGVSRHTVVEMLAPGFNDQQYVLTVSLLSWTLPGGMFLGLAGLTYVVLNAHRQFAWPELAKVVYKAAILVGIVIFLPRVGIWVAGMFMCLASVLQLGLHLLGIGIWRTTGRHGQGLLEKTSATTGPIKSLMILMLPLAIGTMAAMLSGLVDVNRGSTLAPGSLAALTYARKLVDLPVILIPSVLGIIALPRFAEYAAQQKWTRLTLLLTRLTEFCWIVLTPATLIFIAASEPIVETVFARGAFDLNAVQLTSRALIFFSIGLVAYAVEILLLRVYYGTLDTLTPILVGLVFVTFNILLTVWLTPILGIVAIPLALSIQKSLKVATLFIILSRRYPGPWLKRLAHSAWRIAVCGVVFWVLFRATTYILELQGSGTLVHLLVATAVGGTFYFLCASGLGLIHFSDIKRLVCRKVRRVYNRIGS